MSSITNRVVTLNIGDGRKRSVRLRSHESNEILTCTDAVALPMILVIVCVSFAATVDKFLTISSGLIEVPAREISKAWSGVNLGRAVIFDFRTYRFDKLAA